MKKRKTLSDEVYRHMLERLSSGEWQKGEMIPSESDLCKMFDVSRVSVRAAVQHLRGMGLIVTHQGKGSFVAKHPDPVPQVPLSDISGEHFLEIFEFRQTIEFAAIDFLPGRATPEDMAEIAAHLKTMDEHRKNYKKFTEADHAFHMSIIKAAHNRFLYDAMNHYKDIFYHFLEEINRFSTDELEYSVIKHGEIYKALVDQRPQIAKQQLAHDNLYYYHTIFKSTPGGDSREI